MEISRMLMGVQWEFNGDLMGYNVRYIYIYAVHTLGLCGGYRLPPYNHGSTI
jgi:hypothetical protein